MKSMLLPLFRVILLPIFIFTLGNCTKYQGTIKIDLNPRWQFAMEKDSVFLPAEVPGNVFLDLVENNVIPDPFFGNNEQKVQWVSNKNWVYKKEFSICSKYREHRNINLVFDGLDTYSKVYLNGEKLIEADNMFRKWTVPVKDILRKINKLEIYFTSPLIMDSIKSLSLPYKFPDSRAFTRKAPYQYGWDWGPELVTMGIWKDVYLEFYNGIKINDVFIRQKSLDDKKAELSALLKFESDLPDKIKVEIIDKKNGKQYCSQSINISKGNTDIKLDFSIQNPELWWPNGMGEQNIYEFLIRIKTRKGIVEKTIKYGLRTIDLVQKSDSIGSSFYFEVNGKPVFIKGANYIPADNFPSRTKYEKYERLIKDAASSNMNMLRVWGGGIYEKDEFYDLCDKYGIMVWQDFMFACNFYPGDSAFMNNVKQEATEQIIRLCNHPCIALWCGNNEVDEAWHNWGYQKVLNYSAHDSIEIWNNYLELFENILPHLVKTLSANTDYIPTSPKTGWGHKEALYSGDMHYWGVWWGEQPFEVYEKKIGRFMSEYGFQGFPDVKTLLSVVDSTDLRLDSPALLNHQKHPRGMELIDKYMKWYFPVPSDFKDYIYVSQLLQSYGITKAIEAHRRAKPYCMGTLYWQYDDSWPVISWSGIDYYGRWKALQYGVKKSYKKVIISSEMKDDNLDIYIVSDSLGKINGNLELNFMNFEGKNFYKKTVTVDIDENESQKVLRLGLDTIFPVELKDEVVLNTILYSDHKIITEKNIYFVKPKKLKLSTPEINISISKTRSGFNIDLISDKLVKNIQLIPDIDGILSDNFFDILPRKKYRIKFQTDTNNYLKINYQMLNRL